MYFISNLCSRIQPQVFYLSFSCLLPLEQHDSSGGHTVSSCRMSLLLKHHIDCYLYLQVYGGRGGVFHLSPEILQLCVRGLSVFLKACLQIECPSFSFDKCPYLSRACSKQTWQAVKLHVGLMSLHIDVLFSSSRRANQIGYWKSQEIEKTVKVIFK